MRFRFYVMQDGGNGGGGGTGNPPAATPPAATPPADPPKDGGTPPPADPPKDSNPPAAQPKPDDKVVVFDLKLPKDSPLKSEQVDQIVRFAKENGISPEAAQKLLQREHDAAVGFRQAELEAYNKQAGEWLRTVGDDKELGGSKENLEKTLALSNAVLRKYGSPELGQFLAKYSLGNHPELTRFVVRIARAIGEDTFVTAPKDPAPPKKSDSQLFYGK